MKNISAAVSNMGDTSFRHAEACTCSLQFVLVLEAFERCIHTPVPQSMHMAFHRPDSSQKQGYL